MITAFHTWRRHPAFAQGMRETVPQGLGIAAWGLMTGVAMVKSGLSVSAALAMTLLVFAGSAQLAALPLLVAGAPIWIIWATGFCVNLRFLVFSLHLRPYLIHLPKRHRLVLGFFTTDMNYVLFTRRHATPGRTPAEREAQIAYLAGSNTLNWFCWNAASLIGIALAWTIPASWGLGYAGTLCLLAMSCSLTNSRMRLLAATVAGITAILAYQMPLRLNIMVAIGMAVIIGLSLESRFKPTEGHT